MKPASSYTFTPHATSSLWSVPVYLPYVQPPLTMETVRRAEDQLGVALPQSYLALLAEQNGGSVRRTLPGTVHSEIWGIGPYFPSLTGDEYQRGLPTDEEGIWLPKNPQLLVAFDGDGHWFLCLDYRARGPRSEPGVAYVDLELESERSVTESFATFLALLTEDIAPGTLGIMGGTTLEAAAGALAEALRVQFEGPDSFDYGYPQYRFRLGSRHEPAWAWLSPNRVRRGFVRESDERYHELVDMLPGTALRFPTRPDVTLILNCTDDVAVRVSDACARASLPAVPLAAG